MNTHSKANKIVLINVQNKPCCLKEREKIGWIMPVELLDMRDKEGEKDKEWDWDLNN